MKNLSSTIDAGVDESYAYAVLNAQPLSSAGKGLRYREGVEPLSLDLVDGCIHSIAQVLQSEDEKQIRTQIKQVFLQIWKQLDTGLSDDILTQAVDALDNFKSPFIVPLQNIGERLTLIDETTGPTDAFKDLALQMLTAMVSKIIELQNEQSIENALNGNKGEKLTFVVSQTSTSGDTGPAGGAGIHGQDFALNVIGFPVNEATYAQAGQMLRLDQNVFSLPMYEAFTAIQDAMKNGNTDEYREQMKQILEKHLQYVIQEYGLEVEVTAGSFNSVNIGRIDGQTIYHLIAYMQAAAQGLTSEGVIECIPSGNFGHTFAVLQMNELLGHAVNKIIVSTNENAAIYNLIAHGRYKKADNEISCPSVSMIIRYGSNIERLFRLAFGAERTQELMDIFNSGKEILLTESERQKLKDLGLVAYSVSTEQELLTMREVWLKEGILLCPHTANAYVSATNYQEQNPDDKSEILISSTSTPWKFLASVAAALTCDDESKIKQEYERFRKMETSAQGVQELLQIIAKAYQQHGREFDMDMIPQDLREIFSGDVDMQDVYHAEQFQDQTLKFLDEQGAPVLAQQTRKLIKDIKDRMIESLR